MTTVTAKPRFTVRAVSPKPPSDLPPEITSSGRTKRGKKRKSLRGDKEKVKEVRRKELKR